MKRLMIQADEALIERARQRAAERGVSIARVVRDALERELGDRQAPPAAESVGSVDCELIVEARRTADDDAFTPDPWR